MSNLSYSHSLGGSMSSATVNNSVNMAFPVAAAIGAGVNLLGNLIGGASSKSTNKTNLKIAQMNRDFQEEQFNRQIQYNWDMWNATNEYNSAANQRARLEDADLNPYLMLDGGSAGVATGGNSVTPPSVQNVQMQPFHPNFDSLVQAAFQYDQMKALTSETEAKARYAQEMANGVALDNTYKEETLRRDLANKLLEGLQMIENRKKTEAETKGVGLDNLIKQYQYNYMMPIEKSIAEFNKSIAENQVKLGEKQIQHQDVLIALDQNRIHIESAVASAQITKYLNDASLSAQQRKESIARELEINATKDGKEISNRVARETADELIKTTNAENEAARKQSESESGINSTWRDIWNGVGVMTKSLGNTLGGASTVIRATR